MLGLVPVGAGESMRKDTVGLFQIVADFPDVEVGQFAAILVGNAIDQHGPAGVKSENKEARNVAIPRIGPSDSGRA